MPSLTIYIRKAIDGDSAISEKTLSEQVEKVILLSLSAMKHVPPRASELVIMIDPPFFVADQGCEISIYADISD